MITMIARERAVKRLANLTTEQLNAMYKQILNAQPQQPHFRAARMAILDEIEQRGRAVDEYVAKLRAARA